MCHKHLQVRQRAQAEIDVGLVDEKLDLGCLGCHLGVEVQGKCSDVEETPETQVVKCLQRQEERVGLVLLVFKMQEERLHLAVHMHRQVLDFRYELDR